MAVRPFMGDVVLASAARTATASSGPVAAPGQASVAVLLVHCSAASGTTPTLDVALEQSADGTSWSAVTGGAASQLTAAGNRIATAGITANYVRATATIGGTTPSFTFSTSIAFLQS